MDFLSDGSIRIRGMGRLDKPCVFIENGDEHELPNIQIYRIIDDLYINYVQSHPRIEDVVMSEYRYTQLLPSNEENGIATII